MSKDITIQEGGVAKQLTVERLRTNLVGGGTCLWVPEDEVALGQKNINEDGIYVAADDGLYGYSHVMVHGIGAAAGKVPSGTTLPTVNDGNEYGVVKNNNGNLEFQKLPSSIRVTTPPTKTEYIDGETIDFTGMVVTSYDANGESMGVVPFNELILPDTVADISAIGVGEYVEIDDPIYDGDTYTGKVEGIKMSKNAHIEVGTCDGSPVYIDPSADDLFLTIFNRNNKWYIIGACTQENGFWVRTGNHGVGHSADHVFWHKGKAAYFWYGWFSDGWDNAVTPNGVIPETTIDSLTYEIGWLMLYGSEDGSIIHRTGQKIRVQWHRPVDYKMLETSFGVTVTEAPEGEITLAEVDQAITTAQLLGLDVVYIRGVEYTMADAIALRNSLS